MEYGYTQQLWSPPRGRTLEEVRAFLQRMGLSYARGIEHTAVVRDGTGAVAATASLEGHVIKCVAVDPDAQGAGLTATVVTALRQKPWSRACAACSSTPSRKTWRNSAAWASTRWPGRKRPC